MTRNIDGALALVYAQWAQKKLAEGEMADQASKLESVNDAQSKVRDFRKTLERSLADGNINAFQMVDLKEQAAALGIGDEVGGAIQELWEKTTAGSLKSGTATKYPTPESFVQSNFVKSADGTYEPRNGAPSAGLQYHLAIDKNSDVGWAKERNDSVQRIRDAMTDRLDTLKNEASGQELELQMASQEYSRSTQLASNLLNTRNEALKTIVQALSRA